MQIARPQRRLHIVLAGGDRRFLRVAGFLLARRGHAVTTTAKPSEAVDLVELHGTDAVIVDAGAQPQSVLDVVDELETLYPGVRVLVVHEEHRARLPGGSHPLRKWKSIRHLADEVEQSSALEPSAPTAARRR